MLHAYRDTDRGLRPVVQLQDDLGECIWIDLAEPDPEQIARVAALGVTVPGLADLEAIQVSSRLYRSGTTDYMTVVLPGLMPDGRRASRPVCFILAPERLVTVRYHEPEPFRRYVANSGRDGVAADTPGRVLIGLVEEIVEDLADGLEEIGRRLDETSLRIFDLERADRAGVLQQSLVATGLLGERIGKVRLSLLTLSRALNYIEQFPTEKETSQEARRLVRGQARDIEALEVHVDFLSQRVSFVTDATLGLIDLEQNKAVSVLSALVALFAPATLISSFYGMNFAWMPGLHSDWGVLIAVVLMVASGAIGYLYFKWRGWL